MSPGAAAAYTDWIPSELRNEALQSDQSWLAELGTSRSYLSVCPSLTREALAAPAMFGFACLLSSLLIRSKRSILLILVIMALGGGVYAFLGIADVVRHSNGPGLITPVEQTGAAFGPYVNKNNAAGFLNLSLAAAVGLLVYSCRNTPTGRVRDDRYDIKPASRFDHSR